MTSVVAFAASAERFVRDELPGLNSAVESGTLAPEDFLSAVEPTISAVRKGYTQVAATISWDDARYLLQLLGFLISSLERHFFSSGSKPGDLVKRVGCDSLLADLGTRAAHPPRDTHYTYWLWNAGTPPLTFTDNPEEHYFNLAVRRTHELHSDSNAGLRRICSGRTTIDSREARDILANATTNTGELRKAYQLFFKKMTPVFFMTRMRTYLVPYPINGQDWSGVNAANLAAQMQMDYLVGSYAADFYEPIVRGRMRYLTDEDQAALQADMAVASVPARFFRQMIGTPTSSLKHSTALDEFDALVRMVGFCSATHWSLIMNYLVKPAATMSPASLKALAVDPSKGTGKMTHATTERIMHMRRHVHPIRTVIEHRIIDENYRRAVLLFHLEGLTFTDIETLLEWPAGQGEDAVAAGVAVLASADLRILDADVPSV